MSFMHFVQENDAGKLSWSAGPASQVLCDCKLRPQASL